MQTWVLYLIIILGCLLIGLISLYLTIGFKLYKYAFKRNDNAYSPDRRLTSPDKKYRLDYDDEWLQSSNPELVHIKADDGITLAAHQVINPSSHKYVLSCHGYRGSWKELSIIDHYLYDKGFSIIMICERAHGDSEGKIVTMGYKERDDIKSWVKFIVSKDKDAKIVLYGLSMGSASVMMSLNNSLPSNVKCSICDCGYSSIPEEIKHVASFAKKVPTWIPYSSLCLVNFLKHKFSFTKYSATKSLSESDIPVLIIHGEDDTYVPYYMAKENYDAVKSTTYKQLESFKGTWHALSLITDTPRYKEIVSTYISKFIK